MLAGWLVSSHPASQRFISTDQETERIQPCQPSSLSVIPVPAVSEDQLKESLQTEV